MKAIMETFDKTILLIDNDLPFLERLKLLLEKEGYHTIYIAKNCYEALSIIEKNEDIYIITEFYFKSMNGEDLINKIKKRLNGKMKLIILSKTDKLSDSFKTMRLGALSFIHKTEKEWPTLVNESLRNWINYYNEQELLRQEFRTGIYA